jgi:hypothetical protein
MFYMLNFPFNLLSEVIRAEAETCLKYKMKIDILMLHLHLMIFTLVHTKVQEISNTTLLRSIETYSYQLLETFETGDERPTSSFILKKTNQLLCNFIT